MSFQVLETAIFQIRTRLSPETIENRKKSAKKSVWPKSSISDFFHSFFGFLTRIFEICQSLIFECICSDPDWKRVHTTWKFYSASLWSWSDRWEKTLWHASSCNSIKHTRVDIDWQQLLRSLDQNLVDQFSRLCTAFEILTTKSSQTAGILTGCGAPNKIWSLVLEVDQNKRSTRESKL